MNMIIEFGKQVASIGGTALIAGFFFTFGALACIHLTGGVNITKEEVDRE